MKSKMILLLSLVFHLANSQSETQDSLEFLIESEFADKETVSQAFDIYYSYFPNLSSDEKDDIAKKLIESSWETRQIRSIYTIGYRLFYYHKTITYDLDKALYYAMQHHEAAKNVSDLDIRANMLAESANNLGIAYHDLDDYFNAIKYYLKALEYSEESDYPSDASLPLSNIANLYGAMGDTENAMKYLRYSLPYAKADSDSLNRMMSESMVYLTMSRVFMEQDRIDSLEYYLQKNLELIEILEDKKGNNIKEHVCISKLLAARVSIEHDNLQLAQQYLNESLKCKSFAESYYQLTEFDFCLVSDCPDLTIKFKNLKKDWENEVTNPLFDYYLNLKEQYYGKTNQFEKAYLVSKQFQELKLETLSEERTNYAIFVAAQFENQVIQSKLDESQFQKDQQEKLFRAERSYQRKIILVISIFLVLLSVVSFLLFRLSSSRKNLTIELENKNQELDQLNKAKTRFFANVSHELKTPLTLILSPLQKLGLKNNLSDEEKYLIKTAEKNSLDLLDLTNQLLELTAFDVDKVDINQSTFNIVDLIKYTYAEFESLVRDRGTDLELDIDLNKDLFILSDKYKLKTVLKNLISNAIKYTAKGDKIRLAARSNDDQIYLEIHDTGRGIHASDLPYVFERYFQTKLPSAISEGGNGVGLAICKEYAKLLGGGISVSSEYGTFTKFVFEFPYEEANVETDHAITSNESIVALGKESHRSTRTEHSSTILIVEDNPDMSDFLRHILEDHYNVSTAINGVEAYSILQKDFKIIDMIISDIMMPVMNGFELLTKVKGDKELASIPFIILSALDVKDHRLRGLRYGVDDYLTKPFDEEELLARIENLLINLSEKKAYTNHAESDNLLGVDSSTSRGESDWLYELEKIVEVNISDHAFTVDHLAHQIAMSRSLLYKKVKSLTGLTPNNYISQVRYNKAKFYLESKKYSTVKEVAYAVGFKDEKYFSRNFKKYFGKYPSAYL